ncbi:MAG: ATPase [Actinobacteria bacterium]|nr:MAG: ATPase [Actinomycetota bacterium]
MERVRRILKEKTSLSQAQIERLVQVARNMQLLADLGYADLFIYTKTPDGKYLIAAEAKPNTAVSLYPENRAGEIMPKAPNRSVQELFDGGKDEAVEVFDLGGRQVEAKTVPVAEGGAIAGVLSRELALPGPTSEMERTYMGMADQLLEMLRDNSLVGTATPYFTTTRTAGDGIITMEPDGRVSYASPNAVSIYRRLGVEGNMVGRPIQEMSPVEPAVVTALEAHRASQEEGAERGRVILKRAIPLLEEGRLTGILAIVRDVTDLRRREQELRIKEATIREIHHRVKNNLQTIASLLRLQARRLRTDEARNALLESVSRISSIAVVHEILAGQEHESIDFAELVGKIGDVVGQAVAPRDSNIEIRVKGASGEVPAEVATPLAMVITELIQNAMEHAFKGADRGRIAVRLERKGRRLDVEVADDGVGLPEGFELSSSSNLGLQIVQTLVHDELHGELRLSSKPGSGTKIRIALGIGDREKES